MTPEELIQRLREEFGITIDRRTLTNYVRQKLVCPPERRNGGRGVCADYPEHALAEIVASYKLLHGPYRLKAQKAAEARETALEIERSPGRCYSFFTDRWIIGPEASFALEWWLTKLRFENGIPEDEPVELEVVITPDRVEKSIKPAPNNDLPETIWVYEDVHPEVGKRLIATLG